MIHFLLILEASTVLLHNFINIQLYLPSTITFAGVFAGMFYNIKNWSNINQMKTSHFIL